jgi:hypothetical protein
MNEVETNLVEKINDRYKQFLLSMKKGARLAFELGKMLRELYGKLPATASWPAYVKERFCFTPHTAATYIRVYENYKDNPKALADQTISGALKLLSAPPPVKRGPIEYGGPGKQLELPWEAVFSKPPVSGVSLKDHRFECVGNHEVYLVKRELNFPVKVVDLIVGEPDEHLKAPYRGMMEAIQGALEQYHAEVERLEEINKSKSKQRRKK